MAARELLDVWAVITKSECGYMVVSPSGTRSAKNGHACQGLLVIRPQS
jgi:hypothetical protein